MIKYVPKEATPVGDKALSLSCPSCKVVSKFELTGHSNFSLIKKYNIQKLGSIYRCENCSNLIYVEWDILNHQNFAVVNPRIVTPTFSPYNFKHVPETVKKEIEEALRCLSVDAYHGFAAVCRRALQEICRQAGVKGTTKVKQQVKELKELLELDNDTFEAIEIIMLSGHDGAHPNLPNMNAERSELLLHILQDVSYQLFTRPGELLEAKTKRIKPKG